MKKRRTPKKTEAVKYNHRLTSGEQVNWTDQEAQKYLEGYVQAEHEICRNEGRRCRTDVEVIQMMEKEYERDHRKKPQALREDTREYKYGIHYTPMLDQRGEKRRAKTRLVKLLDKAETYEERQEISHKNNDGRG